MIGSVYKTQTFDKQGFHASIPPSFSLPSDLVSTGTLAPGAALGYTCRVPAHHVGPPATPLPPAAPSPTTRCPSGSGRRSQPTYGNSLYWTNWTLKRRGWALGHGLLWAGKNTWNTFLGALALPRILRHNSLSLCGKPDSQTHCCM
jgi:hypothetical protein